MLSEPPPSLSRAHNRDRTGDLILTKDVLYRLSYVSDHLLHLHRPRAGDGTRTRDIKLGRLALYQLSYSRTSHNVHHTRPRPCYTCQTNSGGGRIRTFEGLRRQIYSLISLAT